MIDLVSITINGLFTLIAIITTWLIANWHHQQKPKSDTHFDHQREKVLDDIKRRVGGSFSNFKKEYQHLINKREINEHDFVAFGKKNVDNLIGIIEGNRKIADEKMSLYSRYLTWDEIQNHMDFFNTMLRFTKILTTKESDWRERETDLEFALKNLNEDLEIIKSKGKEYDGISHILTLTTTLTRISNLRYRGINEYNSPSPFR